MLSTTYGWEVQPIFHSLISPYVPDVAIKVLQETVSKASLKSTCTIYTAVTLPTLPALPEGNQAQFRLGNSTLDAPNHHLAPSWARNDFLEKKPWKWLLGGFAP